MQTTARNAMIDKNYFIYVGVENPGIKQEIVHPKMIINSFSTPHYADGGVAEVFESTKHRWSFRGKRCCRWIQYVLRY